MHGTPIYIWGNCKVVTKKTVSSLQLASLYMGPFEPVKLKLNVFDS